MSRKIYVLDTNILLHDPNSLHVFGENTIVIAMPVLEEIDKFKNKQDELGYRAREVSRKLDAYSQEGDLTKGVLMECGSTLKLVAESDESGTMDNRILRVARTVKDENLDVKVILVSRDINMRLKALTLGLRAEGFKHDRVNIDTQYDEIAVIPDYDNWVDTIHEKGSVEIPEAKKSECAPHQIFQIEQSPQKSALVRVSSDVKTFQRVFQEDQIWGIKARNREQKFAFDMLLNPEIELVTLAGRAGTGKTLLSLAAALKQVSDEKLYSKILVARPTVPMGRDLGYLPGDLKEKLDPWIQPIYDNLEVLISSQDGNGNPGYQYLLDREVIKIESLTHIRGRSLPKVFLIIDEAQNLSPKEMKTIITRVGKGTKVVLVGDPYQTDNPFVDQYSNGLSYVVDKFRDSVRAGHVTLQKTERSDLAEEAARLL